MKKILCGLLVVVMVFSLAACGKDLNKHNKELLRQIVDTLDLYLDDNITNKEAYNEVNRLYKKFDKQNNESSITVAFIMGAMTYDLSLDDRAQVLSSRNSLANYI